MSLPVLVEVLVDSVESARAAEAGGAHRLEVCQNLWEGGTTPSAGLLAALRRATPLPANVMVRPRGGDFCYSDTEFEVMRHDVTVARELGAAGLVLGILRPDGTIDEERTAELMALARPLPVTFHRAFDMTRDPWEALETLVRLGVDRVLTSGQEATVLEGAELIAELVRRAGDRIVVMPGGGIRERNVQRILKITGAREIHVSGSRSFESRMTYRNTRIAMGRPLNAPEFSWSGVDAGRVAEYRRLTGS
ncbi:MAG: copper homeostasis protein CutC [Verrucomicrobiota bacterium]